jgi:hypothetical protein
MRASQNAEGTHSRTPWRQAIAFSQLQKAGEKNSNRELQAVRQPGNHLDMVRFLAHLPMNGKTVFLNSTKLVDLSSKADDGSPSY